MRSVYGSSDITDAPLSVGQEVNGLVFLSGQVHVDADLRLVGDTIEEQFGIIMKNIEAILIEGGLTINNIIQVRLYLTDLNELPALNEVYMSYFNHPMPARTAIGVAALPLGASIEIEVVAARE